MCIRDSIRHRRESGGYQKVSNTSDDYYGNPYTSSSIQRIGVDNEWGLVYNPIHCQPLKE